MMGNQNAKKREGYGLNVRGLFDGMSFLNGKKDKAWNVVKDESIDKSISYGT